MEEYGSALFDLRVVLREETGVAVGRCRAGPGRQSVDAHVGQHEY